MRALVTFFSASGVTKRVAERLAAVIGADLCEIEPTERYTDADLNWMDRRSRSSLEMKDPACRPAIEDTGDLAAYDLLFVGFPVWWYREPSVIDTFLESHDLTGKRIVLFATSGGSGIDGAVKNVRTLSTFPNVVGGKRLSASETDSALARFAEEYY